MNCNISKTMKKIKPDFLRTCVACIPHRHILFIFYHKGHNGFHKEHNK